MQPLEPTGQDDCLIALQFGNLAIPVYGLMQNRKGFYLNFYVNRDHTWFGKEHHVSRHPDLIAVRRRGHHNAFAIPNVYPIDDRETPEELPTQSITPDLALRERPIARLMALCKELLLVPGYRCPHGVMIRVKIWPKRLKPTHEELRETWRLDIDNSSEPLVIVFRPTVFRNPVSVAVFAASALSASLPMFIDGKNSAFVPDGKGGAILSHRKNPRSPQP